MHKKPVEGSQNSSDNGGLTNTNTKVVTVVLVGGQKCITLSRSLKQNRFTSGSCFSWKKLDLTKELICSSSFNSLSIFIPSSYTIGLTPKSKGPVQEVQYQDH